MSNDWCISSTIGCLPHLDVGGVVSRRYGSIQDYLKAMVRSGLQLVAVPRGQKGPIDVGWNRLENTIKTADQTKQLIGKNVGLALAYCKPYPLGAIDVDYLPEAENWLHAKGIRLKDLVGGPRPVVFHSGKANSLKILGALTEPLPSLRFTTQNKATTLEFRCADQKGLTYQDLIPPSIHPSGTAYSFISCGSILEVPPMPSSIIDLWVGELERGRSRTSEKRLIRTSWAETPRNLACVRDMLSKVSADCDYEVWRNVCWAVLSLNWSCSEDLAQQWSRTAPERYSEEDFWLLVNSYDAHVANPITVGSLVHYARQGDRYVKSK